MGNSPSIQKINFEDMQEAVFEEKNKYAIINTMSLNKQECLIKQTIPCKKETDFINTILKEGYDRGGTTTTDRFPCLFILYGENEIKSGNFLLSLLVKISLEIAFKNRIIF